MLGGKVKYQGHLLNIESCESASVSICQFHFGVNEENYCKYIVEISRSVLQSRFQ